MNRSYFIRNLIIFLGITFLLIFIVVKVFGNKPKPTPAPTNVPVVKPLPQYADTYAEVSYMIDGHINGNDQHRAIKITIDQFQRKLYILSTYDYNVIQENDFANTQEAYEVFLKSINNEGFLAKLKNTKAPANPTGQCPLGMRKIYELNDSGDSLSKLWGSTCGRPVGTFGGDTSAIQTLFQAQIPDYSKIISNSKVKL